MVRQEQLRIRQAGLCLDGELVKELHAFGPAYLLHRRCFFSSNPLLLQVSRDGLSNGGAGYQAQLKSEVVEVATHKRSACDPSPDSDVDSTYQPARSLAVEKTSRTRRTPRRRIWYRPPHSGESEIDM